MACVYICGKNICINDELYRTYMICNKIKHTRVNTCNKSYGLPVDSKIYAYMVFGCCYIW